jgi:C-1 hydroxylase
MSTTSCGREQVDLEANKALVRSFVEAWNTREFGRFDVLMGEGAVLHIGGDQVPCDPAGTRAIAEEWTSAFPDWRFELLRLVAEGTLVVAHMPYSGTHRSKIMGVEATGRSCTVDEIVIFRIVDSQIAEAWEVYDDAGMWRQLAVPPPV